MKKNLMKAGWMMGLALLASATIASCGDDEPESPNPEEPSIELPDVGQIAGAYAGTANINVMGTDCGEMTFDINLTVEKGDSATVTLPQCSFTPPIPNATEFTIPSIPVHDVKVTVSSDSVFTIKIDDYSETINGVTYTGNIDGKIIGKDADIRYVITPGRMPMPINFSFTGTRK